VFAAALMPAVSLVLLSDQHIEQLNKAQVYAVTAVHAVKASACCKSSWTQVHASAVPPLLSLLLQFLSLLQNDLIMDMVVIYADKKIYTALKFGVPVCGHPTIVHVSD
jgi:hypothetical protein